MNRPVSVAFIALVVVVSIVALGPMTAAGTGDETVASSQPHQAVLETQTEMDSAMQLQPSPETTHSLTGDSQDFDRTTFKITVHENGSATWTFQYEQRFGTGNETEEDDRESFEEFAAAFESEETELYEGFTEQADAMVDSGGELTDREMDATNFERSATVEDQFGTRGIVEMSFTWSEFADVEDGVVEVGDVFQNLYIGPDQAIEIEAADDLTFDRVEPAESAQYPRSDLEDADSVRWSGEQQFLDSQPWAVLVQDGATAESDSLSSDNMSWYLAIVAIIGLGIAGGGLWYRRQSAERETDTGASAGQPAGPDETAATTAPAEDDQQTEPSTDAAPLADEELLTDEDRVVRLIRENGGRMKQVNIVDETGWSKSKVSMLLSDMEEEDTISKLRVGRENIISLEGYEPEATKSPFDE
ncbi:helix-turn-helix transcriptional regulator [Natronorubrum sp. A-ect3]|uniref:helix-turn-helix transcriptional regulator n=1 Tax=Natronorubrum sp. A-ect3 TaxID=3242698 RepID=UPI00359DF1EB